MRNNNDNLHHADNHHPHHPPQHHHHHQWFNLHPLMTSSIIGQTDHVPHHRLSGSDGGIFRRMISFGHHQQNNQHEHHKGGSDLHHPHQQDYTDGQPSDPHHPVINRKDYYEEISWYRICRNLIRFATLTYLGIGFFIVLVGVIKLLWATTAITSIDAGCIMIASFVLLSTSTMGYLGALQENFCLIMSYGCLELTLFILRFVSACVRLKINFTKDSGHVFRDKSFFVIQDMISSLPGSDYVALEFLYAFFEVSLATSALVVSVEINRANSEREEEIEDERYKIIKVIQETRNKTEEMIIKQNITHLNNNHQKEQQRNVHSSTSESCPQHSVHSSSSPKIEHPPDDDETSKQIVVASSIPQNVHHVNYSNVAFNQNEQRPIPNVIFNYHPYHHDYLVHQHYMNANNGQNINNNNHLMSFNNRNQMNNASSNRQMNYYSPAPSLGTVLYANPRIYYGRYNFV